MNLGILGSAKTVTADGSSGLILSSEELKTVAVWLCAESYLPSFGASFGPPEGLRILLEPGQVAFTGLRVGVLPHSETGF